jgi:hypothetical protein
MPLSHVSVARMLGRDKYVLGIDSVLKASGAVTSAFIKSGSRPPQSVRAGVVVRGLSTTAQHRRHRKPPRITEQLRLRSFRPWPHEPYAWPRPQQ